ncbi:protein phosphatase 2C domain-containing protein [Mycobacterium sp. OTB74]|uniref:PP2C family protein-serine/threonine phosphatase n=1 Tax=Mycobacterium sp. OTB74 TaxID=1853452 RepID=UPI002475FEA8|nr:protein phosphatase 2C domain-containing protein [Mycobacterium sp. OTB74]MDH6244836.1 serine/threonine protein phosphatase PrpC [Mycobacterium sp. OTB74]
MRVSVRAFTDTGLRRKRNEDAVMVGGWVSQTHNGVLVEMRMQPGAPFVCAVCDGMGGHVGGDVASRTALSMIATMSPGWTGCDDIGSSLAYVSDWLHDMGRDTELAGMGTTIAGVCLTEGEVIVFNVGDSRVYSINGGELHQVSVDDAVLDEAGRPTNIITQSLGQGIPVNPHLTATPLAPGSYLMCSDGVHGQMEHHDLQAATSCNDRADGAAIIIGTARANGAADNFTFILLDVIDD